MSKIPYKRTSRFFTHLFLWKTSQTLRSEIDSTDKNPTHFEYSVYLTLYFCLEAYMNFVGEILYPDYWENEQEHFSKDPYRGTIGKLKWLSEELVQEDIFSRSERPGQTISNLEKIRNKLVHGTLEITEKYDKVKFSEFTIDSFMPNPIEKRTHDNFIDQAFTDVELVINKIHQAALDYLDDPREYKFPSQPLAGSVQVESGGTINE